MKSMCFERPHVPVDMPGAHVSQRGRYVLLIQKKVNVRKRLPAGEQLKVARALCGTGDGQGAKHTRPIRY
jgi:hypothetical protein